MQDEIHTQRQDVFKLIYKKMSYLNPALRRIADYILENPAECRNITTKELAAACQVAESSITRFVKEIGLDSYRELKLGIAESLTLSDAKGAATTEDKYVYEDISRHDDTEIILDKILHRNVMSLTETRRRLNVEQLGRAVEAIERANTILFSSMGSSSAAAMSGVIRFTRAGKKCLFFNDQSSLLMTASITGPDDLMIGISNSGRSKSVVESLKIAKSKGAVTIGITSYEDSPLVKYSDIPLFTSTKSTGDESALYWEASTSKSAQILVLDALYACYAAKHFDKTIEYLGETFNVLKSSREK